MSISKNILFMTIISFCFMHAVYSVPIKDFFRSCPVDEDLGTFQSAKLREQTEALTKFTCKYDKSGQPATWSVDIYAKGCRFLDGTTDCHEASCEYTCAADIKKTK